MTRQELEDLFDDLGIKGDAELQFFDRDEAQADLESVSLTIIIETGNKPGKQVGSIRFK